MLTFKCITLKKNFSLNFGNLKQRSETPICGTADTCKIALNVVKASNLVQMKLMTYRSKLALRAC